MKFIQRAYAATAEVSAPTVLYAQYLSEILVWRTLSWQLLTNG